VREESTGEPGGALPLAAMSVTASERTLTAEVLRARFDALEAATDQAADEIRASLSHRRDAIADDQELSPIGRRSQREEAEREHRERMTELRAEHDDRRSELLARARVTAFGAIAQGSELAARDASDRAMRFEQDRELARELRRALERRDHLYVSALAERALELGAGEALDVFERAQPRRGALVRVLADERPKTIRVGDREHELRSRRETRRRVFRYSLP
jgi:hypothetical protein